MKKRFAIAILTVLALYTAFLVSAYFIDYPKSVKIAVDILYFIWVVVKVIILFRIKNN